METHKGNATQRGSYGRFFAMIGTAMVAMFLLMYLNSYQILDHARFSETRLFMTFIMGGSMIVIMLAFMLGMYTNGGANAAVTGRSGRPAGARLRTDPRVTGAPGGGEAGPWSATAAT